MQPQVLTPSEATLLRPQDAAAMRDIAGACCAASNSTFCRRVLPRALAPNHSPEEDLCHTPPLACDGQGRLVSAGLASAGLECAASGGMPAAFGRLDGLKTLDLAFNNIGGDVGRAARVREAAVGGSRVRSARLGLSLACCAKGG